MIYYLTRHGPRHSRRFYFISAQRHLLSGQIAVTRQYGQVGGPRRSLEPALFDDEQAAVAFAARVARRKRNDGYTDALSSSHLAAAIQLA